MKRTYPLNKISAALAVTLLAGSFSSFAQETSEQDVEKIDVVGKASDYLSIIPSEDTSSAFGLTKSLYETPRSVTEISEDLVEKFALRSVDDLVRLTPGAFTSSFFGIKGAMDIRGEAADNYFRGFRRIANPGAFNTIVRGAEKLEVLRGPVSPLYGSGSVGGQLNYIPKSAKVDGSKYIDEVTGDLSVTVGSYNQRIVSGSLGIPLEIGGKYGGVQFFAEVEDSESFFHGYEPSSSLFQAAVDFDLSDNTTLQFGLQYQESDSIQVPGWNRVTQDLIDNGTYITGAAPIRNSDNSIGANTLLPQETSFIASFAPGFLNNAFSNINTWCTAAEAGAGNATYNGLSIGCAGGFGDFLADRTLANPYALTDVGTTTIDHKTTFIDEEDYADTTAITAYFDITHEFENGAVWKNEAFYDYMDHTKYQSWGFTAFYPDAYLYELRSSLTFDYEGDSFEATNVFGVNYRVEDLDNYAAWFDETFDFRDISVGPTPNDRISPATFDPYQNATLLYDDEGNVTGVEGTLERNFNEVYLSKSTNAGVFFLTDITYGKFSLLLGGRYDYFDVESENGWVSYLGQPQGDGVITGDDTAFSFNTSLSYNADGIIPYITYSESNSLSTNQLGGIIPTTIENSQYIQESTLSELGVKMNLWDSRLYAAFAYYDQDKTYRDSQTNSLIAVYGDGFELELRALVTEELSILATATNTSTEEVSDGALAVINGADFAAQNGLNPEDVYGGRIAGPRAAFVGSNVRLDRGGLPDNIISVYGTWAQELGGGDITGSLGFTWVDETFTDVMQTVMLPSYTVWNGSVSYATGPFTALLQANNLLDEEYYTSADLFDSVVVKPSAGRTFSLTLTYAF
ncbi:TonB-dependent receptor plug domain-containing protein [Alteromonas sp. KUL49]|uniref:TonB-dependent siderophore receptor n=1 Tax=Alteromonas sp. KUL49 TaxID=2480798 RepID=UPI00102F0CE2|nr:TonB-dependent receptor plug domain-containing protein [Alteromonas sp. KUL49]TAP40244.1 TonB-dependent receptor [Alteromonas sp. KUL49]GEA11378.1 TonB-dependent receptor [Alteromonas sp. KUL49]